ncbi:response regulator transcription factor [Candidatus Gracilibacteria bacterium 28_42_T64]|nr:response regulator transcription factor [Candidatus Gracilibacteria bacterium 28_42_T64]
MNILIIEDDVFLAARLKQVFEKKIISNRIKIVNSYIDFIEEISILSSYDIVLTDIKLGNEKQKNGINIVEVIRRNQISIPIIVMSCFSDTDWIERAFNTGANDYIIKPFRLKELELRVQNWFKAYYIPSQQNTATVLEYGGLSYNIEVNDFFYGEEVLVLTKKSKYILSIFFSKPDILISEDIFIDKIWGDAFLIKDRNLRVCMLRLKRGLEPYGIDHWIINIRGEGYILKKT